MSGSNIHTRVQSLYPIVPTMGVYLLTPLSYGDGPVAKCEGHESSWCRLPGATGNRCLGTLRTNC